MRAGQLKERQYNIFRWYRGAWGRHTQADLMGAGYQGTNLYVYADDSPSNGSDPSGLFTISAPPKQTKLIAQAMVSINHKLASMGGCCAGPLRDKLMELLSDPGFEIAYHASLSSIGQCGMTPGSIFPGKTTTVWLGSGPFNGKCCTGGSPTNALASTILHEMVHAALSRGPSADPAAYAAELRCYGCKK